MTRPTPPFRVGDKVQRIGDTRVGVILALFAADRTHALPRARVRWTWTYGGAKTNTTESTIRLTALVHWRGPDLPVAGA